MSEITKKQKERKKAQDARNRRNTKRKPRLPITFFHQLKELVGTEGFILLVQEQGNVNLAIKASTWYLEVSQHELFGKSKSCHIWMRRISKRWLSQQRKRLQTETAKTRVKRPKIKPVKKETCQEKRRRAVNAKLGHLQTLLRDSQTYIVASKNLGPALAQQKLLRSYDVASHEKRAELAEKIKAIDVTIRASVFIGSVTEHRYSLGTKRFDWSTNFEGVILQVEFTAKGFKSTWKATLENTGTCNTVKGWESHHIHRRTKMPVRFNNLVITRIKESKPHLLRDLELTTLAS